VVGSSSVAAPSAPQAFEVWRQPAGEVQYRICIDNRGATEFADCAGPTRRFGPWKTGKDCVPVLYVGSTVASVVMEVAFHDVDLTVPEPKAFLSDLRLRRSTIAPTRDLKLARLDDDALARLGIKRDQLIDTPPHTYGRTVKWAKAAHASPEAFDGVIWHSRRHPSSRVSVWFADRVDRLKDVDVVEEPVPMLSGSGYEEALQIATDHGITIIH